MRVSIGPGDVAGYLGQLANGFRAIGVPCEHFLYIPQHQYGYPAAPHFLATAYDRIDRLRCKGAAGRLAAKVGDKLIRAFALIYALFRYDVFIFSGYGSFFRFAELPLLRLLGKRVIVIYLGSDARPPYLSGKHLDDQGGVFDAHLIAREARAIAQRLAWVERFAIVVNHTGTAQFAERKFVRLSAMGLPMALRGNVADDRDDSSAPLLRLLHAPSRPLGKGSPEIREVVGRLRAEGLAVELTELNGVPNSEVLRHIARCDVVVDELYSDVPMATLAAEAAMFGKPAIVGSLYAGDFVKDNPDTWAPPTFFIDPARLEATIRMLLADPAKGAALGTSARRFVEENSSPAAVARRYCRLAAADIPAEWIADPKNMTYLGGWGLSDVNRARQLSSFIDAVGVDGLSLKRRPDLQEAIVLVVESARAR